MIFVPRRQPEEINIYQNTVIRRQQLPSVDWNCFSTGIIFYLY